VHEVYANGFDIAEYMMQSSQHSLIFYTWST
jgi:hypothetical protein